MNLRKCYSAFTDCYIYLRKQCVLRLYWGSLGTLVYRSLIIGALMLQYIFFKSVFSHYEMRSTSTAVAYNYNHTYKYHRFSPYEWALLKEKYSRRRYTWRIPKNVPGITYGRKILKEIANFTNLGIEEEPVYKNDTPMCKINFTELGRVQVYRRARLLMETVEKRHNNISLGGFYAPKKCRAVRRIAIIVPYKDRYDNLVKFLNHMHRIMKTQRLEYRIFVIEQYATTKQFNKGTLYNAGFIEIHKFGSWPCLILHDVDLLLQDTRNIYSCDQSPYHLSPSVESHHYSLRYPELVGGVMAITSEQYLAINGFSNSYYDWGGEDDDLFVRLKEIGLNITHANFSFGRYAHVYHKKNSLNVYRFIEMAATKRRYRKDGLNNVAYRLINITKRKLFTHIVADVNPFNFTIEV